MPHRSDKRVLFVSYQFPPVGGAGVQRVSKFVKYLPDYGWDCSVLTAANPPAPLIDDALLSDVSEKTVIRRARTLEPGFGGRRHPLPWRRGAAWSLLQPDPQVLWRPFAIRAGLRLLRELRHDAIIATGPPFSSLLLGATLSRRTGVPLVLDYRDEWGLSQDDPEKGQPWPWLLRRQRTMQRSAIQQARALLATTPSSALHLAQEADQYGCKIQVTWIYNGFDQDDFAAPPLLQAPRTDHGNGTEMYRVSYVGTLWELSPIGPFVAGVEKLALERPDLAERLELVVAGSGTDDQERELDRLRTLACRVVRLPFLPHGKAAQIMRESDALLLLNADRPDAHRIVNAKTFEYIAARRPILTVAPDGDLWDVVRDLPGTMLCQPCAEGAIAESLIRAIERHAAGLHDTNDDLDISAYEHQHLAGELAVLLDEVVGENSVTAERPRPPAHPVGSV